MIRTCPLPLIADVGDPGHADRVLFLGPDDRGIPLEVVAIELDNGDLVVIHAMRMRRKYRSTYTQVMRW